MPDIYVARDSASVIIEGDRYALQKGLTRVRAGHPLVERHPELFEPLDVHYDVEDATQAPGRRRGGRRAPEAAGPQDATQAPEAADPE